MFSYHLSFHFARLNSLRDECLSNGLLEVEIECEAGVVVPFFFFFFSSEVMSRRKDCEKI